MSIKKYVKAQREIMSLIARENMAPGSRLPEETEISRMFEVSNITTRRALKELADLGIIERIQGRGTFVKRDISHERRNRQLAFVGVGQCAKVNDKSTEEANRYGYSIKYLFFNEQDLPMIELDLPMVLNELEDAEGIFLTGRITQKAVTCFRAMAKPVVIIGTPYEKIEALDIRFNWRRAAFMATDHYLKKGCQRIAFINGAKRFAVAQECAKGFREALKRNGKAVNENDIAWCPKENWLRSITEFFDENPARQYDAILVEEGVFSSFLVYRDSEAKAFSHQPAICPFMSMNQEPGFYKTLSGVKFSKSLDEVAVSQLVDQINGNEITTSKTISIEPEFIPAACEIPGVRVVADTAKI